MTKLVKLNFVGSFENGFTVSIEIRDQKKARVVAKSLDYSLSSDVEIPKLYKIWRSAYEKLGPPPRILLGENKRTNISSLEDRRNCRILAKQLSDRFNTWLGPGTSFGVIRELLVARINPDDEDEVRILLVSNDDLLQRLPWHSWDLFSRYSNVEFALSPLEYDIFDKKYLHSDKNNILAIFGGDENIDISGDLQAIKSLPNTETDFLPKPLRKELNDKLLEEKQWDILFFTGHSCSQLNEGIICINDTDSLNLEELSNALKHAVSNGLQLAIFNSCDGLGLAQAMFKLNIPQVIVMREPIADKVAEEFLKYFLSAFANGTPLYLAVHKARKQLQGMENEFPCASWLPMICQNHPEDSLIWKKALHTPVDSNIIGSTIELLRNIFLRFLKKTVWHLFLGVLALIFAIFLANYFSPPEVNVKDRISDGDRVLIPYKDKDKKIEFPKEKLEGVTALKAKNLDKAISSFENSIRIESNDPETWIYLNNVRIGNKDSLKIAVSVPIGENLNVAQEILRGVAQAQDDTNNKGGINGKLLKVVIGNDDNVEKIAAAIAKEFADNLNILAVVGHNSSKASLAADPAYRKAKLVVISPTSNATDFDGLPNNPEYKYYRTLPSIRKDASALVDYARKKAWKKVAICFEDDPSSKSLRNEFIISFQNFGSIYPTSNLEDKFCYFPTKEPNANEKRDFNPDEIVLKLSENKVNGLLLLPNIDNLGKAIDIVKANYKTKIPLIGSGAMYTSDTLTLGKEHVKDMVFASIWNPDFDSIDKGFSDNVKKWGKINWRTVTSYDAMQVIIAGLKADKSSPSRNSLRQFMSNLIEKSDVPSLAGIKNERNGDNKIIFNKDGDRNAQIKLVKIQAKQGSPEYEFKLLPENE